MNALGAIVRRTTAEAVPGASDDFVSEFALGGEAAGCRRNELA